MTGPRAALRVARSVLAVLRRPLYVPPGHFYSPSTSRKDITRAVAGRGVGTTLGIDLRAAEQRALVQKLVPLWKGLPTTAADGWRYRPDNLMFGPSDAVIYHSVLRHFRPERIIEVGSGFSSAIALDTVDRHLPDVRLTFVEPYPQRLLSLLTAADRTRTTLLARPVQDVPLSLYEGLRAGDVLFIDSTHVVKAGSDVIWLILEVLPRLAPGVLVHVHDVFWPFEYPESWLWQGRDWTEAYLLRAFLAYNHAFEILLFSSWLWQEEPELVRTHLPHSVGHEPGSLWLRKTA
ncbi:MAG: class I SAM-dependent methyltransferase [Egibacteraceae bacterium]